MADDMCTGDTINDIGAILESIEVAPVEVGVLGAPALQEGKDIFAEQQRKGWDKSVEARCDFILKYTLVNLK